MAKRGSLSTATVSRTEQPRANPAVLYRELRTGCLLYHPGTNEAHALNLTAAYVWTCCDGGMDVTGIAACLAEACRIPIPEALRDVKKVLKDFHAKKLLV